MGRTVELDLVDNSRATPAVGGVDGSPWRSLPSTIHLPPTPGPAPLVVLAHGFNGHPAKFTALAGYWAQAGYVVAVPRFPVTSDRFPLCDPVVDHARIADLPAQAEDIAFIVARLRNASVEAASPLAGRIDTARLGLYGMSLGALTVWAATQRAELLAGDVDALVQSDGAYPGDAAAALPDVKFPVMIAHSDADAIIPIEARLHEFDALPSPKFLLVLHGVDHAVVAENNATPADDAYRAATTTFWHRYLRDEDPEFPSSITIDGVTTFVDGS